MTLTLDPLATIPLGIRHLPPRFCRLAQIGCFLFSMMAASTWSEAFGADTLTVQQDSMASFSRTDLLRSPRAAAFRSVILPGWGQFYNARPIKGGVIAAAEVTSFVGIVIRKRQLDREREIDPSAPRRNVFIFTTLGLIFYSAVDAYVDAHLWGSDTNRFSFARENRAWFVRLDLKMK